MSDPSDVQVAEMQVRSCAFDFLKRFFKLSEREGLVVLQVCVHFLGYEPLSKIALVTVEPNKFDS